MTKLSKPVRRETDAADRGRLLVVTLHPSAGGTIIIREKGRRKGFSLPVLTVYRLAAQAFGLAEKDRKRKERVERRRAKLEYL